MIKVINKQRKYRINSLVLKEKIKEVLAELKVVEYDVGICFLPEGQMATYNKQYRQKEGATDVLSFPFHNLAPPQKPVISCDEDKNLGDILICLPVVERKAPLFKRTFHAHAAFLLIHSILHLLGYDHETESQHKAMARLEKLLLARFEKGDASFLI